MSYYVNNKVVRTLPEQVAQNQADIELLAAAQDDDHSQINQNTNDIAADSTRITSCESITLRAKDGALNLYRSNKADMGTVPVKTIGGNTLLESGNIAVATINGESILQDKDFVVDANLSSTLYANLGIGRWASQKFFYIPTSWGGGESVFYDDLMPFYTNYARFMSYTGWVIRDTGVEYNADMVFNSDFNSAACSYDYAFYGVKMNSIELPNMNCNSAYMTFAHSTLESITVKDNCNAKFNGQLIYTFFADDNLTTIGAIDVSDVYQFMYTFDQCPKLKKISAKHFKASFNISSSTAFEQADLVEIIGNLDAVSSTQTLTMGSTNLAKLTNEQILVATGKGWVLA